MSHCVYNGTTSQFTNAADGLRHRSVVNGVTTNFALDASMFVRELRNGASTATYLVGARGPEYRRDDVAGMQFRRVPIAAVIRCSQAHSYSAGVNISLVTV